MFERFTDRARKVMQLANGEAQQFGHEYIGTEHVLLGLVKEDSGVAAHVLKNLDVDLRKLRLEVEKIVQTGPGAVPVILGKLPHTPRTKKAIEYSTEEARNLGHNYVGTEHLLLGLMREEEGVAAQVLMNLGVDLSEVREEVLNLLGHVHDDAPTKGAAKVIAPVRSKTPALDVLSCDLTELARQGKLDPLVGRDAELRMMCEVLACRGHANPILLGEAGIGKTSLVGGLAQAIVIDKVPDWLRGHRVVELPLSRLWGNAHDWSQMSAQVRAVFNEVRIAKDLILFLPHFVGSLRTTEGGSAAEYVHSEMLLTLGDGKSRCILAATPAEFQKAIERQPSLNHLSQPIDLRPSTLEETAAILLDVHSRYESHHQVVFEEDVLTKIGESADRELPGPLPGKAVALLDRSAAKARTNAYVQSPDQHLEVLKIGEQIRQLNDQKESFVAAHDFSRAAELHDKVKSLQNERVRLLGESESSVAVVDIAVVEEVLRELTAGCKLVEDGRR